MKTKSIVMSILLMSSLVMVSCGEGNNSEKVDNKYNEIFKTSLMNQLNYDDNISQIDIEEETTTYQYFENGKELTLEEAKKITENENLKFTNTSLTKEVRGYNKDKNYFMIKNYENNNDEWIEDDNITTYIEKNNREYRINTYRDINNLPNSMCYKLSKGHIANELRLSVKDYLGEEMTGYDLNAVKQALNKILMLFVDNPVIKEENKKEYDIYSTKFTCDLLNIEFLDQPIEQFSYELSIDYSKDRIESLYLGGLSKIKSEMTIGEHTLEVILTTINKNDITYKYENTPFLVFNSQIQNIVDNIESQYMTPIEGTYQFYLENNEDRYNVMNQPPFEEGPIEAPTEFNFPHASYKYYSDINYQNEISLSSLKTVSFDKNIYVKVIMDEGYTLLHEKLYINGFEAENKYTTIDLSKDKKFNLPSIWEELKEEEPFKGKTFNKIIVNGKETNEKDFTFTNNNENLVEYYYEDIKYR